MQMLNNEILKFIVLFTGSLVGSMIILDILGNEFTISFIFALVVAVVGIING